MHPVGDTLAGRQAGGQREGDSEAMSPPKRNWLKIIVDRAFERLLYRRHRSLEFDLPIDKTRSAKNIVESLGVPHTEIGALLADGHPVDFDFRPAGGCTLQLLPVKPPLDVTRPSRLRPEPFDRLRFIVDVNVGKLALLLRMLGLDAAYCPEWGDRQIAERAEGERRVVLSKDVELLKQRRIRYGRMVRASRPEGQLAEVAGFFGIQEFQRPFSRCLRCNTELVTVEKHRILEQLEPKTRKYYHRFKRCPDCRRIFWQGSHHERMIERLENLGLVISPERPSAD